jgi:hypothetical protein
MERPGGHHGNAAVFAADGATRHHLVRAAIAAGAGLLAAWLIALALGVLGGFGSLPGLPHPPSAGSSEASSQTKSPPKPAPARAQRLAPIVRTAAPTPTPVSGDSSRPQSHSSTPKTPATQVVQPPSTSAVTTSTNHGQGTTRTTGKPVGSPGNGAGGSGAPGQLR